MQTLIIISLLLGLQPLSNRLSIYISKMNEVIPKRALSEIWLDRHGGHIFHISLPTILWLWEICVACKWASPKSLSPLKSCENRAENLENLFTENPVLMIRNGLCILPYCVSSISFSPLGKQTFISDSPDNLSRNPRYNWQMYSSCKT